MCVYVNSDIRSISDSPIASPRTYLKSPNLTDITFRADRLADRRATDPIVDLSGGRSAVVAGGRGIKCGEM